MKLWNKSLWMIALVSLVWACSKDDDDIKGPVTTPDPVFTITPWVDNGNYLVLDNQTQGVNLLSAWKFKADSPYRRDEPGLDTAYYPAAGTYTISLATNDGSGVKEISQEVVIDQDDPDLAGPGGGFITLADWESGTDEGWNEWGQAVSVADNPNPSSVNASDKVLKMTQNGTGAFSASAVKSGIVDFSEKSLKITIDAYFESAGSLKLQIEGDFATGYFLDAEPGKWVTIEYNLEGEINSGTDYPWVLIQGNTEGDYYIDNVRYYATDISAENGVSYGDFEDGEVGDWNAWGQAVSVVDNPDPSAANASGKVLLMTQTEPFANNAVRNGPVITENAKKVTIDVYFTTEGSLKFQIEADFATGYFQDVEPGSWVTLTYNLEGEVSGGIEYPWLVIQGNTAGNYYIDNITYFE